MTGKGSREGGTSGAFCPGLKHTRPPSAGKKTTIKINRSVHICIVIAGCRTHFLSAEIRLPWRRIQFEFLFCCMSCVHTAVGICITQYNPVSLAINCSISFHTAVFSSLSKKFISYSFIYFASFCGWQPDEPYRGLRLQPMSSAAKDYLHSGAYVPGALQCNLKNRERGGEKEREVGP